MLYEVITLFLENSHLRGMVKKTKDVWSGNFCKQEEKDAAEQDKIDSLPKNNTNFVFFSTARVLGDKNRRVASDSA